MKKLFLTLPVLFVCLVVHAQDKLPDFGKIDIADLQMKECPFDKGADAMILFNTAAVHFDVGYYTGIPYVKTERRVRIKIFNERGFSAATIAIPYYSKSRSSKVSDVDAVIYNLDDNGNIVVQKLERDEIFREKSTTGKVNFNSIRFTFPNLKNGCVVEYRFTKNDKGSVIAPWIYQDRIPVLYSSCKIFIDGAINIAYKNVSTDKIEVDSTIKQHAKARLDEQTWTFSMHNVPALKTEPFMSSLKDNLQRSEFSVSPAGFFSAVTAYDKWAMYNSALMRSSYFGSQFDKPLQGTDVFINSVLQLKTDIEKIEAVYGYVKGSVAWNGEQIFLSDSLEECWYNKQGSSAEINMVLLNLLRRSKIYAYPILVSTRENGKPEMDFPNMGQFNGMDVLAYDESNTPYILDCTQKGISFKTTPINVLNRQAFVIDPDKFQWVDIVDRRPLFKSTVDAEAEIDSAGMVSGIVRSVYTGIAKLEAVGEKESPVNKPETRKTTSISLIDNSLSVLNIDSTAKEFENDDNDTLIKTTRFHFAADNTGNIYFLNPFMFSMFKKDPFVETGRVSDIDFGCNQEYSTKILIKAAANFVVEGLPRPVSVMMPDSSILFKREFSNSNNQIVVHDSFQLSKTVFSRSEYAGLKSFFDKVYALINEQIVLNKK